MAVFQYANNPQTTLSGAVTVGATSLNVASAADFPTQGKFTIIVDSEIMLVTGVSGTTWTVTRGHDGTSAAAHTNNSTVTQILTVDSFLNAHHYDVRAYGAKGNASTDDAIAINSAISAAAAAGGGEVYFPPGTYSVGAVIGLKEGVSLVGAGREASIIQASTDANVLNAASSDTVTGITIAHLKIVGFGSGGSASYGINLDTATQVLIHDVWVDDTSLTGIRISACSDVHVVDCRVTNVHGSTYPAINILTGERNVVRGCYTSDVDWVCIGIEDSVENLIEGNTLKGGHTGVNVYKASHRNRVIGNDCETSGSGVTVDGATVTADDNVVANNMCHDNAVRGIFLSNAPRTQVVGNICTENAQNAGIYVVTSEDVAIVGNYCYLNIGYGIHVTTTCPRPLITGNKVHSNGEDGIRVASSNHATITGNQVYSNAKHGIYNASGGYAAITGNTATDNGTGTDNTYAGIVVDASRNTITGNTSVNSAANGSQAYGIRVASGTNNVVVGNVTFQNETANISNAGTTTTIEHNVTT